MPVGDLPAFNDQTPFLVSRMNKATVISGSGTYLAGLSLNQFKLLHCTSTGSGFTIDHIYLVKGDGSGVQDLTGVGVHLHNGSTDGGETVYINQRTADIVDTQYFHDMQDHEWTSITSGTGVTSAITNLSGWTDNEVLKLDTGSTSGSGASFRLGGFSHDYQLPSGFSALIKFSQTTDIASHWGYNMETITSSDDNNRKYGFTQCTSVNQNWFGRSADGDSRSDSDTGIAITSSDAGLQAFNWPAGSAAYGGSGSAHINFSIADATVLTKTNDVPNTGENTDTANLWKFTLKNNTASSKVAHLIKLRVSYYGDSSSTRFGNHDLT